MYHYPTTKINKNSEPIIFIHGTGMDHTVWTLPVRHYLRKKREVISIDLPGHGRSPDLDGGIDTWCNEIIKLIPEKSILFGWSLGGLLSIFIANKIKLNELNAKIKSPEPNVNYNETKK